MCAHRFGQNQWEAIAKDERLGLRDKLAAAAAEKTLKKAGKKLTDKDSQLLPRGQAPCCQSILHTLCCYINIACSCRQHWQSSCWLASAYAQSNLKFLL